MTNSTILPITRMVLYKHGVGFFERRAKFNGDEVALSFRIEEMKDVLKSITPIDWSGGQVLGMEYATPQERKERLAGCSVSLSDERSLQDLLIGLRGRRVTLRLDQGESATGSLIGLDRPLAEQPLSSALVSLLADEGAAVRTMTLGRVQGVDILDDQGAADLRFFLQTSLIRQQYNQVILRLSPGEHDLSVSYVAPAPTWRVSYRLVANSAQGGDAEALLFGWGIFDNRMEEDLRGVRLSLVAGMPVSFIYDLYTPFTPERPEVQEEARVVAGPIELEQAMSKGAPIRSMRKATSEASQPLAAFGLVESFMPEVVAASAPLQAAGKALGELFQYDIATPVSVGRGQSAMAPIVSARLACSKDLIYSADQMAKHPTATLRLGNTTRLTLERGPVTVIDNGEYVGEAILAYTGVGGEIVVPYAVELGVSLSEEAGREVQIHSVQISGRYLSIKEWDIRSRSVQVNNSTDKEQRVLVEHTRQSGYELFETPAPVEQTATTLRFAIAAPAHGESVLHIRERRLLRRREEISMGRVGSLQQLVKDGQLSPEDRLRLEEVIKLWLEIANQQQKLDEIEQERNQLYKTQEQMRANLQSLSATGKEGALRASYVDKLQTSEDQLGALAQREAEIKGMIAALNVQVDKELQ
jgi:hypothetical protein